MPRDLIDLHIHVGGAVAPHILWSIAHNQGFKLPFKDYWEFCDAIVARPEKVRSLEDYLGIFHQWTEKIQSSPAAIERSVYEIIGKEYRGSRVTQIELRFNPMKRNLGGERDLDHIIHAAIRGMDRACLEWGVRAGLIFCLAREFEAHLNEIIVEKAIKYRTRGVVGIDLAGTEKNAIELMPQEVERYRDMYARAREAGLGTTVHTGETQGTGAEGVAAVVEKLQPDRIGHGIRSVSDERVMKLLRERGVVLELCPTSNLLTHAVSDWGEMKHIVHTLIDRRVPVTLNTDGPYLLDTDMAREVELVKRHGLMSDAQIDEALATAREASFLD
ncbi:MAG TPA: adenosine deaminase [Myxococcales bacterium]|nr:adenosine deaminase [Myxococcales bacterium]